MNKLSVEEVAQRRTELRKMRELMFRAEIKAKRVSKIKSKTYRKIKRKERERLENQVNEELESDEESRLKKETERAKERATLRHKNTGKWAKQMKGRNAYEEGGRADIEEMLDRGEKLRRRIAGLDSDESDVGEEKDSEDEDVNELKRRAFQELQGTTGDLDLEAVTDNTKSKVFGMKFMKDAMARRQQESDRMVDDFRKEMDNDEETLSDDEQPVGVEPTGVVVSRHGGRAVYRPGATVSDSVICCNSKLNTGERKWGYALQVFQVPLLLQVASSRDLFPPRRILQFLPSPHTQRKSPIRG